MNRRDFLGAAAAAPLALVFGEKVLAGVSPSGAVALVTADLESHVVAYDVASGRVLRHIETLPGPKSIETVGNGSAALVAHTAAGAISLIDAASLRVKAVLQGFVEPRYTASAPDGRHAYVTDAGRGEVVTVDLGRARIVGRTVVGAHARHISLDRGSKLLWTALGFSAPEIVVVHVSDPVRLRVAARIAPPFPAHDVVFAPGGERVWVSSGSERRLALFNARTRRVLFTPPAGQPPQHITFTSDAAYVTSDDLVRVHALRNGRVLRETPVPGGSYNVTHGAGHVFTPSLDRGTLSVLDERGRLLSHPTLAKAAHDACFVVLNP